MKREGFADEEIYDVLAGIGLPGEEVQLIIDRVSAEFSEAKIEPRTIRLASEVKQVFEEELGKIQHEISTRVNIFSRELMFIKNEVEKLGRRVVELQTVISGDRRRR